MNPVDRVSVAAATFFLSSLPVFIAFTMPVWLGLVAAQYGYSEADLGQVGAWYFGAFAISAGASIFWTRRTNWRAASGLAVAAMATGFAVSGNLHSSLALNSGMLLAGLGGGALLALSFTITSDMTDVDRRVGIKMFVEQTYPALLLYLYSVFFGADWGMRAGFSAIAAVIAVTGLCALRLPARSDRDVSTGFKLGTNLPAIVLGLAGIGVFFGGFAAFWAFFERLGQINAFDGKTIARWVAIGTLLAGGGGLLTAVIGDRWGRLVPIVFAGLLTVTPLFLLGAHLQLWQYALAAMVIPAANTFGTAYQIGFVAHTDITGRFSSLIAAVLALASMAGISVAGVLIESYGYTGLYWFTGSLVLSAVLIFVYLVQAHRRSRAQVFCSG